MEQSFSWPDSGTWRNAGAFLGERGNFSVLEMPHLETLHQLFSSDIIFRGKVNVFLNIQIRQHSQKPGF
jgi:hypothetical protein